MAVKQSIVFVKSGAAPTGLDLVGRVSYCGSIPSEISDRAARLSVKTRFADSARHLGASHVFVTSMRREPGQVMAYGNAYEIR